MCTTQQQQQHHQHQQLVHCVPSANHKNTIFSSENRMRQTHSIPYRTRFAHKIAKQTRFFNSQNGFLFFIHILQLILVLQLFLFLLALGKRVCLHVCVRASVCVCLYLQTKAMHSMCGSRVWSACNVDCRSCLP